MGAYLMPGEYGVSTGTTRFSGAQLEVGTYPTSLIVTTTTALARNADVVSATVPAVPSKWCVAVTAKPEEGRAWADPNLPMPWGLGPTNVANSAFMYSTGTANVVRVRVNDSSNFARDTDITSTALSGGAASRLVFCNNVGSTKLTLNGSVESSGWTGAGTGLWTTPPTTLNIGMRAPLTTTEQFGGYLKNLKICSAKNAKECK
jgi:hypothetical protein